MKSVVFFILLTSVSIAQSLYDPPLPPVPNDSIITFPNDTVTVQLNLTGTEAALITYGLRTIAPGYRIDEYIRIILQEAVTAGRVRRDFIIMTQFWNASPLTKLTVANELGIPTDTKKVLPE